MRLRVYLLLLLLAQFSDALFSSLKDEDEEDYENDEDYENHPEVEGEAEDAPADGGENGGKPAGGEGNDGDLGKIRISIDNDISIDTGGTGYTGHKTPLIIISPTSIIDYARLNKKMESSKKESNILVQEKLAMSDANSRLASLYRELKEAEARLAFYKADKSQLELLNNNNNNNNRSHDNQEF